MDQKGQFSLKLVQKCPVCSNDYTTGKIQILEEEGNSFLAYLTCSFCSSSILIRVMSMPHGLVGNAILTDLAADEVMFFSEENTVSSNDVLEIHDYFSKQGDFIEKFK
ncbi:hypothetical protein HOE31_02445 [bacterium]|jgi:formate dehydrogenase maturation protein FdhE|nr:hypothetical protein [bacterium]MBT4121787.1 hypothetical protein [bacterium]MBT4335367.1 hypothetical protein [bacterium]MBT4495161.1 hypothetical protein [bacterium]MBT4763994.1 hypothetical protein [bacterium]